MAGSHWQTKTPKAKDPLAYCYNLLSFRPRTVAEIRNALKKQKILPGPIAAIIAQLEAEGLLNDIAFGEMWINERCNFNYKGRAAIKRELYEHGLNSADLEYCLDTFLTAETEQQSLAKALWQISKNLPDNWVEDAKTKQKVINKLIYRGFSGRQIALALSELNRQQAD